MTVFSCPSIVGYAELESHPIPFSDLMSRVRHEETHREEISRRHGGRSAKINQVSMDSKLTADKQDDMVEQQLTD